MHGGTVALMNRQNGHIKYLYHPATTEEVVLGLLMLVTEAVFVAYALYGIANYRKRNSIH